MNRTQKGAWFGLVVPCFPVAWYFIVGIFSNSVLLLVLPMVIFLLVVPAFMLIAINKKQSPDEIASDERDKMIKAKAVMASYISAWIMLAVVIAIMMLASNEECMVEAILLVPLSVLMFIISVAVYSISTLIQYGKGGGGYE